MCTVLMVLEVILVVLGVVLVVLGVVLVVLGGSRLSFLISVFLLRVTRCTGICFDFLEGVHNLGNTILNHLKSC